MATIIFFAIVVGLFILPWFFKQQVFALYRWHRSREMETAILQGKFDGEVTQVAVDRLRDRGII